MAQHKQLTWTELRVGLFVLAGAVLLAVVIFYVTGGSGWGPKYRLHAFLPEVDGLTTVRSVIPLAPGDMVRAVVTGSDGVDLIADAIVPTGAILPGRG